MDEDRQGALLPADPKFLGKLFLINFAIEVVTGMQEFQFGMS